jgi:hypothetical protein
MLNRLSHRTPSLLAVAVTGMLAWAGKSPALASSCAPGATDKPDLGFVDSNCDGIDGDKGAALFVAPAGDDNNDGSLAHPKKSVTAAVIAATTAGKDVYAAAGIYDGKVPFLGSTGHIGLYGGYDPQTWQRSAANVTTLQAPGQVVGVAVPGIVLQLLTIHSLDGSSAMSSYGVRAFGSGGVALSRVTVQTANGADGSDGAPSPPAKAKAMDGASPDSNGCDQSRGAGGVGTGYLAGGLGGTWNDPQFTMKGYDGKSDPNDPSVSGGIGGTSGGQKGGDGTNGHQGSPGMGGSATLGRVALFYQAEPGGTGTDGTRGAGGGGGAASPDICVSGSGGGAGGLGGVGGKGGQGGGASIGVFAGAGARILVLDSSVIHTSNGGHGGFGQPGQPSGPGGLGGKAASRFDGHTTWFGGAGGNGGWGGQGGRGGGGAGGVSIGVLAVDARAIVAGDSTITVGAGGAGGNGANDGKPGVAQKTAETTTAGGTVPAVGDFDADGIADDADACPTDAGTGNGCPSTPPAGPVAGDPTATAPATGSATGATAAVAVSVLPTTSCVDKRVFRIRINARKAHIKTARLVLDGHRLKLVKRSPRRWVAKADLRHSTRSKHTLTIRGTLRSGKRFKQTRRYLTCP